MRNYLTGAVVLMLLFSGLASAANINWLHTLKDGLATAQKSQQAIMVESYTDT